MEKNHTGPEDDYRAKRQAQKEYAQESDRLRRERDTKLASLWEEREAYMKLASKHAGNLGLVYIAERNDYIKLVSGVELPPPPPILDPPKEPEPAPPPPKPATVEHGGTINNFMLKHFHWFLALPVGAFVGYGLASLLGLSLARDPILILAGIVIGCSVIVGMKILFWHLWHFVGKQTGLGQAKWHHAGIASVITILLVAAEVFLGGFALVLYSQKTLVQGQEPLSPIIATGLAIAVSTAIVLISAVTGYKSGFRDQDERDHQEALYKQTLQHHQALENFKAQVYAKAQADYATELKKHEENREKHLAQYREENEKFDNYKQLPEYQTLLQCISYIGSIDFLIENHERLQTNTSISRGHGQKYVL